jgi:hypothetical protein
LLKLSQIDLPEISATTIALDKLIEGLFAGSQYPLSLGLADLVPAVLDFRQLALIDSLTKKVAHFNQHVRTAGLAPKGLAPGLVVDLLLEFAYKFKELGPELGVGQGGQLLEFGFVVGGAN